MKILCVFILFFSGYLALANSYYVTEVLGTGIDVDLRESVREIAKTAVSESGEELVDRPEDAVTLLRPKLIRLGRAYILTVSRIEEGRVVYSSKAKSSDVEELDTVITRTVRASIRSKKVKDDVRVGEVTEREKKELQQRRQTLNLQYFAFGPFGLQNMNTEGAGIHVAWGYLWEVNTKAAVRFTVEGTVDGSKDTASLAAVTLGASYYLNTSDISPYVFGDFGYGAAAGNDIDRSSTGFSLGTGVGVIFFRTATTQMDLALRYLAILDENEKGTPSTVGVRLGILF